MELTLFPAEPSEAGQAADIRIPDSIRHKLSIWVEFHYTVENQSRYSIKPVRAIQLLCEMSTNPSFPGTTSFASNSYTPAFAWLVLMLLSK